jgi:hypothetical protein
LGLECEHLALGGNFNTSLHAIIVDWKYTELSTKYLDSLCSEYKSVKKKKKDPALLVLTFL